MLPPTIGSDKSVNAIASEDLTDNRAVIVEDEGMTQLQLQRIPAQLPVCILMLTAYTEHREEAVRNGASGYVVKPIDSATLLADVHTAWNNWQQRRPH